MRCCAGRVRNSSCREWRPCTSIRQSTASLLQQRQRGTRSNGSSILSCASRAIAAWARTLSKTGRYTSIVQQVVEELEKHDLESDIWRDVNSSGRYCAAQICLRGHIHSIDGTPYKSDERCPQCGEICIDRCPSCKAPIRGAVVYSKDYTLAFYCYKCGRAYPWMEDRLQTARGLLNHDDKLSLEDRDEFWGLLQFVMSDPKIGHGSGEKETHRVWSR
jgi:hypothetical protein